MWAVLFIATNLFAVSKADMEAFMASGSSSGFGDAALDNSTSSGNSPSISGDLIDNSIDSTTYYIGGGDVFSVHVMELPSTTYSAVIDQNCDAVIPELGLIRIGKKNLGEAKAIIGQYVKSKLKKPYTVYVSLTRVKSAIVSITGAVTGPGTYQVQGTYRLLDVIRKANGDIMPSLSDYNYREVLCYNGKDSAMTYDLFQYLFKHDLSQNPYVYPGDNIVLDYSQRSVNIFGSIHINMNKDKNKDDEASQKKQMPIKKNESAKDFLSLLPLAPTADTGNIIIKKYSSDGSSHTISCSLGNSGNIILENQDMVVVSQQKNSIQGEAVIVSGEILSPGIYPIVKDKTTAEEILKMAGGVTASADIDRAVVIRHKKTVELKNAIVPQNIPLSLLKDLLPPSPAIQPGFMRPEVNNAINNSGATSDYAVILLNKSGSGIILEAADEICIPKKDMDVYVSGKVSNPGTYPYVKGKDRNYYVQQAGGFVRRADKMNVSVVTLYGNGSAFHINDKPEVIAGDIIVVPESQQYKKFNMVWSPALSYIITAISLSLTAYALTH
jgi:protein involved in polysaccharide export with SLBB domain